MSLTYSEIYTTSLRAQSKILNGEKTHSPSKSKYVSLIKKFSKKQKSRKNKQKRIISKSVQTSKPIYNKKQKNKTISKQKLENKKKQKQLKDFNNNTNDYINNEINNQSKQQNFNSSDVNNFNSNFSERNDNYNRIINKFMLGQKIINDNNKNYSMYNTLQNTSKNYYNFSKLNKSYNNDYIKNFINLFRLKQNAANFRDKIKNKNNTFNVNISNDLLSSYNSNINNDYFKTHSYSKFNPKKSKTILKANKLREEIEKITNVNKANKKNLNYRPYSNFYNQNYLSNDEQEEINNNKENININNDNDNNNFENEKYDNIYNNDNNDLNSLTHHFFDRTMRVPKRIVKYFNSPKNNMNSNSTIKSNNNNSNNCAQKKINYNYNNNNKNNKKNGFRKKTNLPQKKVKLVKNNLDNFIVNNNLNDNFSSDLCRAKFNKLDNITQENAKLNTLLKKIPSNRAFRNKSYDLMEYIIKLKQYNNKKNLINSININNNIDSVYPANECEAFKKMKKNFFD